MAGTIQIKRSSNTATPTTLEFGELAWSSNGQTLSIGQEDGNTSNVVAIAGPHTPGTLTANQALVANSTSSYFENSFNHPLFLNSVCVITFSFLLTVLPKVLAPSVLKPRQNKAYKGLHPIH